MENAAGGQGRNRGECRSIHTRYQYEVFNLTFKMLGERNNANLKAKGGEVAGLLPFAFEMLGRHRANMGDQGEFLYRACQAALMITDMFRTCPKILTDDVVRTMLGHFVRFSRYYYIAGGVLTPKFHLMIHCILRARKFGNPRFYWTFRDESMQLVIGTLGRHIHRLSFHRSLHTKLRWMRRNTDPKWDGMPLVPLRAHWSLTHDALMLTLQDLDDL